MNGNCETCDIEAECGYEYKPCDCCNYRKFKPKPAMTFQMTFTKPAALAKIARIKELLAERPMTALELSATLPLSKRWTQAYLNHLHAQKLVYISGWTRKPQQNQTREYPRPRYAAVPEDKYVYDAKKPKPFTSTEISKREWKAIKADPERHMTIVAQRRKRDALRRVEITAAANNPFKLAA
jgi:hypothetical protein